MGSPIARAMRRALTAAGWRRTGGGAEPGPRHCGDECPRGRAPAEEPIARGGAPHPPHDAAAGPEPAQSIGRTGNRRTRAAVAGLAAAASLGALVLSPSAALADTDGTSAIDGTGAVGSDASADGGAPSWIKGLLRSSYSQVWSDEFNGDHLDESTWGYQTGGWGDAMQQVYRKDPENVSVSGGALHLRAVHKPGVLTWVDGKQEPRDFTSGFVQSKGKRAWKYGYFEARVKLPASAPSWCAFWLSPNTGVYGGWPKSGEIDVFESKGYDKSFAQADAHWWNRDAGRRNHRPHPALDPSLDTQGQWHDYGVLWEPGRLAFYLDGAKYHEITEFTGSGSGTAPFDQDFYLRFNHGVGGNFLGAEHKDARAWASSYPSEMLVDHVRVWQLKLGGGQRPTPPPTTPRPADPAPSPSDPGPGDPRTTPPVEEGGTWVLDGNGWWYRRADGSWPASTSRYIDGAPYVFDDRGYALWGSVRGADGRWRDYALDGSGRTTTGRVRHGDCDYWYGADGRLVGGGWWQEAGGGRWKWVPGEEGAVQDGWIRWGDGHWYYARPGSRIMATGWERVNGDWYHLNGRGEMDTGWIVENGRWYYLYPNGVMAVGWHFVDGTWQWFSASGVWNG